MAELKIRVTAAADASLRNVFRPIEEAAKRAESAVRRSASDQERAQRRSANSAARDAERASNAAIRAKKAEEAAHARAAAKVERELAKLAQAEQRAAARSLQATLRAEQAKTNAVMREFDRRLRAAKRAHDAEERDIMRVARQAERAESRTARAAERNQRSRERQQQYDTNRLRHDLGHRAVNNMNALGRGALNVGRDVAMGMGVDFSIGGAVGRNVELQRRMTQLSNAGYIPSEGKDRVATGDIEGTIKGATDATGFSRLQGADALERFVAKTGQLRMGMAMLKDLGTLAQASGADLGDLADAAGDVASSLGNIEDEGERTKATQQVLRTIVGQGKIGAVEIKDLATQMAKVATSATAFEGDTAKNVGFMGALTQMARATGGAASANQAATSASAFVNTLRTPARMKAFQAAGVNILNKQTGEFLDPEQIILASLSKTQGDPEQWKKLFANVQGARAVEGAAMVYRRNRAKALEGGATEDEANLTGLAAVKGEFEKFRQIAMGEGEIGENFAARMGNDDVRAQQFQNRLDDVAQKMQQDLVPAFEKLAPHVVKVAEAFASLVSWAAENPGKAITAAIVGSIAKASLDTAFAAAVERAFGGTGGPLGGGHGGQRKGKKALPPSAPAGLTGGETALAGLAIAAAAVSITAAGVTLIDEGFKAKEAAEASVRETLGTAAENKTNAVIAAQEGNITVDQLAKLRSDLADLDAKIAAGEEANSLTSKLTRGNVGLLSGALNWATAGSAGTSFDRQQADMALGQQLEELRASREELSRGLQQIEAAVRRNAIVQVSNLPGVSVLAEQAGRTGSFIGGMFGIGG